MDRDEQFESILREALDRARGIPCEPVDYRAALRNWIEDLRIEIDASLELDVPHEDDRLISEDDEDGGESGG